ncbi:hypothetical protein B7R22_18485, partial [Subtercola boreus]
DLIIGTMSRSAIGTLVERSSRFVSLIHLPHDHTAETVRDGLVTGSFDSISLEERTSPGTPPRSATELNARPRKSLDWDTPAERLHALLEAS